MKFFSFVSVFICVLTLNAHNIVIENMLFNPPEMSLDKTHKITWINKDLVPHTVTSTDKAFDSKAIAPGASFTFQAKKHGKYSYSCSFHPTMRGSFTVK